MVWFEIFDNYIAKNENKHDKTWKIMFFVYEKSFILLQLPWKPIKFHVTVPN